MPHISHQTLRRFNATLWLLTGGVVTYTAVATMYPASVLDAAWRAQMVQTCASVQPRCLGLSFESTRINGYWHGVQVRARAVAGQVDAVRDALNAATGAAAAPYVELSVAPATARRS